MKHLPAVPLKMFMTVVHYCDHEVTARGSAQDSFRFAGEEMRFFIVVRKR